MALMTIATPGKKMRYGAYCRKRAESVSISPHSAMRGSPGPRPRKPRPATSMMAVARASVAWTMSGVSGVGEHVAQRMRKREAPIERAAMT